MDVWVFTAARSSPSDTTPTFPGGVFSSLDTAEEWIKRHARSGTITLYRVDVGAYDWQSLTVTSSPANHTMKLASSLVDSLVEMFTTTTKLEQRSADCCQLT